ncbi:MAG: hypothetical protein WD793_13295 [Steroidobacteraceae bacterium]
MAGVRGSFDTAVLLLAFNRPDTTLRVFDAIRKARPARLYVAVDGPRAARDGEAALCEEVRRIASAVDWPCALHTRFREENLGCKRSVSSAIDWFFSQQDRGIILEDDCLPSASFFRFCEELLQRFEDDPRVFSVQGNFFGGARNAEASYLYSKMFYMWGWASWADRWQSVRIDDLDVAGVRRSIRDDRWLGRNPLIQRYWLDVVDRQAAGEIDSWGYPAMFHCFGRKLFNVTPTANLVLNIGVGPSATRTPVLDCGPFHTAALDIAFPLAHGRPYEGPDEMLPFEHRWRIQLSQGRLAREVLQARFPLLYRALQTAFRAVRPRSRPL